MTPEEALAFAVSFVQYLPAGWGFSAEAGHDGIDALILTEIETGGPWMVWLSKGLIGGRTLRGGVLISQKDTPQDVEARAWIVLGRLQVLERQDAAGWN